MQKQLMETNAAVRMLAEQKREEATARLHRSSIQSRSPSAAPNGLSQLWYADALERQSEQHHRGIAQRRAAPFQRRADEDHSRHRMEEEQARNNRLDEDRRRSERRGRSEERERFDLEERNRVTLPP